MKGATLTSFPAESKNEKFMTFEGLSDDENEMGVSMDEDDGDDSENDA